jgi:hypothetical protein
VLVNDKTQDRRNDKDTRAEPLPDRDAGTGGPAGVTRPGEMSPAEEWGERLDQGTAAANSDSARRAVRELEKDPG